MSIYLVRVFSTAVVKGYRKIKSLCFGKADLQTPDEGAPYGFDSNPVKDTIAILAESSIKGEPVIIGYLNKNRLAAVGEARLYSTDDSGQQKFYVWLKNDGTCEIGGNTDNMVRYSKLETAFNQLKTDFNNLVGKFNSHTHPYTDDGSPATTSATTTPGTTSSANIAPAKINEIKTL